MKRIIPMIVAVCFATCTNSDATKVISPKIDSLEHRQDTPVLKGVCYHLTSGV